MEWVYETWKWSSQALCGFTIILNAYSLKHKDEYDDFWRWVMLVLAAIVMLLGMIGGFLW